MKIKYRIEKYLNEKEEEKDKVIITITTNNVAANSLMPLLKKLKAFGEDINISVNSDDKDDAQDFVYAGKEGRIKSIKSKPNIEDVGEEGLEPEDIENKEETTLEDEENDIV